MHHLLLEYLQTKDLRLRDQVIFQYRNLVESVARRFVGSGEPVEDLIQEGYIGLITAVDLYDADKGVKFSTYATHFIIGQIKHSLRDRGKIIKEPAWLQELNYKMARVIDSLYQEFGRQPTELEIGRVMHLSEETVAELLTSREIFKVASLDCDQDETSPGTVDVEKVKNDKYTTFQLPVEDKIVLETAMNKLKLIEQKVINEFYYTGASQTEIAKKLGISCNYVSHILRNGTKKLRRILTTEEIKEAQVQLQLASRRADGLAAESRSTVIDAVTGSYCRRYLDDRLEEEIMRAVRAKSKLYFAIMAIGAVEEFKSRFGSMRRDDVLYSLAKLIKEGVRRCDIVGRFGEAEFGLIMPHTGHEGRHVCNRICEAIRKIRFDTARSSPSVTFEIELGCAVYPDDAASSGDLIKVARAEISKMREERTRKAA